MSNLLMNVRHECGAAMQTWSGETSALVLLPAQQHSTRVSGQVLSGQGYAVKRALIAAVPVTASIPVTFPTRTRREADGTTGTYAWRPPAG